MSKPSKSQDTTTAIGSTVKVVNSGEVYTSYIDMANFMGLDKWKEQRYDERGVHIGEIFTVVAKAMHERSHEGELVGLQDSNGRQVIMHLKGVQLVSAPTLSGQVAELEQQLAAVTKERDELRANVEAVRRLFQLS